jgi:hypothetical protein
MQKGFNVKSPDTSNYYLRLNINYVEVPLLFKFTFGGEKIKGFFEIGNYFGYWVGAKSKKRLGSSTSEENEKVTFDKAIFDRYDIGLGFGGGVSYNTGAGKLLLDLRYYLGVVSIENLDNNLCANRTLGVSFIYLFNLKKN